MNAMASNTDLETLAETILAASKTIKTYFTENDLPQLSFSPEAPLEFPSSSEEIQIARRNLREASKRIYDLATGPGEHIRWLACHVGDFTLLIPTDAKRSSAP